MTTKRQWTKEETKEIGLIRKDIMENQKLEQSAALVEAVKVAKLLKQQYGTVEFEAYEAM